MSGHLVVVDGRAEWGSADEAASSAGLRLARGATTNGTRRRKSHWHDRRNGCHIRDVETGFVAGAPRAPAARVARAGDAAAVAVARLKASPPLVFAGRGAGAPRPACEGDRPARVPASGRRLRRVVQRALDDADPREAEDHAADVGRAHVRRDAAGREGGADRGPVHEAALGRVRGRRRRGDPVVPRSHGERRRARRPRRACRTRSG